MTLPPIIRRRSGPAGAIFWWLLALAACLSVLMINGRPLFYYDTAAYIDQGTKVLTRLGLPDPAAVPAAAAEPGGGAPKADSVDGSRSAPFAVLLALFARFAALNEFVVINAVLTLVAIALPLRVARRLYGGNLAATLQLPRRRRYVLGIAFYPRSNPRRGQLVRGSE